MAKRADRRRRIGARDGAGPNSGVDVAHMAAEMFPGDPLGAAYQANFELSTLLAAVLERTGPVRVHKDFLERRDLVTFADWKTDEDGCFEVRILDADEIEHFRGEEGQAASLRAAKTVAAHATDPGSA